MTVLGIHIDSLDGTLVVERQGSGTSPEGGSRFERIAATRL